MHHNTVTNSKWVRLSPPKKENQINDLKKLEKAAIKKANDASYGNTRDCWQSSASHLDSATKTLKKALEAEDQGKQEVATSWKNLATQHQVAANWYQQTAEAIFQDDLQKGERCKTAAEAAEKEADRFKKIAQNHK